MDGLSHMFYIDNIMEGFEKKVLIVAGIILVVSLVLVLIFILMSKGIY